jgi:hypothetical protein
MEANAALRAQTLLSLCQNNITYQPIRSCAPSHRKTDVRRTDGCCLKNGIRKDKETKRSTWHAREMLKLTHCLSYKHLQTTNNSGSTFCSFTKKSRLFWCVDRIKDNGIGFKCLLQGYNLALCET